jgi:hypothetical protein
MDRERLQLLFSDPDAFFADSHNFAYAYFMIIFGVFTVARMARIPQSTSVPVAMALLLLLFLLQNRMITLSGPLLFFAAFALVGLVLGIRYLERYRRTL